MADLFTSSDPSWAKSAALSILLIYGLAALKFGSLIPRRKGRPLPPGPPGLPVIGNIFDVPADEFWRKYKEWSDQYG